VMIRLLPGLGFDKLELPLDFPSAELGCTLETRYQNAQYAMSHASDIGGQTRHAQRLSLMTYPTGDTVDPFSKSTS
jgi:hypothetical protein